jgi:hypothetical protein
MRALTVALAFSAVLFGFVVAAEETRLDAFGRSVDLGAWARAEVSAKLTEKLGSPEWSPVGIAILEAEGKALARFEAGGEVDLLCQHRYRKEHPEHGLEQYLEFLGTADGLGWKHACGHEILAEPQADPKMVDSVVASIEIGLVLPSLVQQVRQIKSQQGLPDTPELSPEIEARLPAMAARSFAVAACLMREVRKEMPFASLLTDTVGLQNLTKQLLKDGDCGKPAPKTS